MGKRKSSQSGVPIIADPILRSFITPNESDSNMEPANVVDGLFAIARSLEEVANALYKLGNGNDSTSFGAIEAHAMHTAEALDRIAANIGELASGS